MIVPNTTIQGDCLDLLPSVASRSVDMVLCDLPYGTTACKWDAVIPLEALWAEYSRVVKDHGAIVLTCSQPFTTALIASNYRDFRYCWVWDKRFAANFSIAKYQPLKRHEDIAVFSKGTCIYYPQKTRRDAPIKLGKNVSKSGSANLAKAKEDFSGKVYEDKNPESILLFSNRDEGMVRVHPTQKPMALWEYLIRTYTTKGDTVLDNCCGSGTTGVACRNTGRNFIQMEISPKYCEIARQRLRSLEL